jgi:histidinol-phosphate aminotransferase
VEPEQVFAGNGSDEVLAFAFGAFFEPRNGSPEKEAVPLLFPDITYSFYPVYADLWDIPVKTVALEDDFSIDHKKYLVPSAGAVIPNPNAPTAMTLPVKDLLSIAEYLEKQGGGKMPVLLVDEAYAAFGAESAVPFINGHPGLLTVHTLSKMGALAGLRVGFAIGNRDLIEGLRRVRDSFNSYTVDALAQAAAAAAISDRAYYDGITARIAATRVRVSSALAGMGFTVLPSGANFIFIKPPEGKTESVPGEFFYALRERGILVRHFNRKRIASYLRVTIGADGEMDRFLEACGEILKT